MENKHYKSYHMEEPTVHRVNVFNLNSQYRYLFIHCERCKFYNRCLNIKHKREICLVAKKTEELLMPFTQARVSSFLSDEFYIQAKSKHTDNLKRIFKFLRMKYVTDQNGRE